MTKDKVNQFCIKGVSKKAHFLIHDLIHEPSTYLSVNSQNKTSKYFIAVNNPIMPFKIQFWAHNFYHRLEKRLCNAI